MRRRRPSEEQQRDLFTTQADLTALSKHPGWVTFEREISKKLERIEKAALAHALSSTPSLSQLAYWRGQIDGLAWLVRAPVGAEQRLERFLKEQVVEEAT